MLDALGNASLVHFAGHSDFLVNDPSSSYLELSEGDRLSLSDLAAASDMENLIVVLNSCESARSSSQGHAGTTLGISELFVLKGASAIVSTNWHAEDRASLSNVSLFYMHIEESDNTVAEAMRQVRQRLFRSGLPIKHWALYGVFGHPFTRPSL